jgi:hypothetical protein
MQEKYSYTDPRGGQIDQFRQSVMGSFQQMFQAPSGAQQQDRHQLIDTDKKAMSDLTTGVQEAFTGNPLKAMRHRRKKQFVSEATTRKGQKIATEKGILELVDQFKCQQDDEPYEENSDGSDGYEAPRPQREDLSPAVPSPEARQEWDLPLLDEERYILGEAEDPEPLRPKGAALTQAGPGETAQSQKLSEVPLRTFQKREFKFGGPSPKLGQRKYKTMKMPQGGLAQKKSGGEERGGVQQKGLKPLNQLQVNNAARSKIFKKPQLLNANSKVKRFRMQMAKKGQMTRLGTAPVNGKRGSPKTTALLSKKPFRIKPLGLKELANK